MYTPWGPLRKPFNHILSIPLVSSKTSIMRTTVGHKKITVVNDQNINTVSTVLQYCTVHIQYSTSTVLYSVLSIVLMSYGVSIWGCEFRSL